jgi:hypothetical protein
MIKKIIRITLIVLVALLGLAFAAPFLFKDKITALVKKEINNRLNAKVDFADVDISLFRHFPRLAAGISNIQVVGTGDFAKDTLFAAKKLDAALNLMSVIRGKEMTIYSVNVDEPRIHAIIHKDSSVNWDIVKPATSADADTSSKPFSMKLESYSINDGYLQYVDEAGNMSSEIEHLNHSGSGDFTADLFTLKTKTEAGAVTFNYGNIPWLYKTKLSVSTDIQADNKTSKYSFSNAKVLLNDLELATNGFFQLVNDSVYNMDISYSAPSTDFKNILSLVPTVYQKNFASVKTSGKALFNGFVKGTYSGTQIPAYNLKLEVNDGFFQYPDLPSPVKNINLALSIDNPDGVTDHTVVNMPRGHIEIDKEPFDLRLLVKTPLSDLFVDAAAKGKLDLAAIGKMVKLEAGTQLTGLLNADISASGHMSALERKQYEQFNAAGAVSLANFAYQSKAYPDGVKIPVLQASFTPQNLRISELRGEYLKTNFSANGAIDNILAYALQNKPLTGIVNLKADQLNLNQWMGTSADTSTKGAAAAPFAVPANLNLTLNAAVDRVVYDKVNLDQLSGTLLLQDETVSLNNLKTNLLDGSMLVNGSYSTKLSKLKPAISLQYDVKGLDVEKTFTAFNTVDKLMPVGKFLSGKLSSQLSFNGKLGDNMMPDLSSLSGNGNLLLIEGFLRKFLPLEKLAGLLNINELQSLSLKDVKTYFDFANGKVLVKPFKVKVKDIEMEIGGLHGLDQSLDYTINLKVPRALMGDKGNNYINGLVSQVNSKGIPVKLGDYVNLTVKMGGSISNPQLKTDLKQTGSSLAEDLKQQATDFVKAKADSAKKAVTAAVRDTLASVKKQAIQAAGDALKKQLFQNDSSNKAGDGKKNIEESAKGLLKNLNPFGKKKQPADSSKKE